MNGPGQERGRPRRWLTDLGRRDTGMVTAETAVVLPVLLIVLAVLVGGVRLVDAQLACQDAARIAARAAARGERTAEVQRLARSVAPRGVTVSVRRGAGLVRVEVTARVRWTGPLPGLLPSTEVRGQAVAASEVDAAGPAVARRPG